jgi:malate/lactate dehydrogenase
MGSNWSHKHVTGWPPNQYCPICYKGCGLHERNEIADAVRSAAYEVLERKGATYNPNEWLRCKSLRPSSRISSVF